MKLVDLHVLLVCFFFVVTCSGSKLICFFLGRICFRSVITWLHPKPMLGFPERHMCPFLNLVGSSFTLLQKSRSPLLSVQLKMADELAAIHDLLSCVGETPRLRPRKTPPHLQDVAHLACLRKRRMIDVKWNHCIQQVLRMHERPRICLMLPLPRPLPRPPAELPLADAIQQNVARFLSSADEVPVDDPANRMPSSPLSQRSSRMPTSSSSEGWEYVPLHTWTDCGYRPAALDGWPSDFESGVLRTDGHPNVLCYRIYSDDETQQAVQRAPETLQLPLSSSAKLQPKPPPKPPFNLVPPPSKAAVPSKAAPEPPVNLFQPPPKAAAPFKAAPQEPFKAAPHAPFKAAPQELAPPPKEAPANINRPPNKQWKKKAPREIMCPRCGHGTILHQFM